MTGNNNREVITGSDFKRMVSGAYSEFLLEYEKINRMNGAGSLPGTHVLHTMGAAVMTLRDVKDDSIGGLARRVASGAILGARGSAGIVLAQLFNGIRRPIITLAKAVAKGAYQAVRANKPISEILTAAIAAGEVVLEKVGHKDAGASIMFFFLAGCLKGLDGNFVSPAVSLSLGLESQQPGLPDPRQDLVRPFCVRFTIKNTKVDIAELEKQLKEYSSFALAEKRSHGVDVHIHSDHPGLVLESAVGWGPLKNLHITNMSEPHVLEPHDAIMKVALLAVAENKVQARELQEQGIHVLVTGSENASPSVSELINAAHSDIASSYVMVAWSKDFWLAFRQARRLLGDRVELVLCDDKVQQAAAVKLFDPAKSAKENAEVMLKQLTKVE